MKSCDKVTLDSEDSSPEFALICLKEKGYIATLNGVKENINFLCFHALSVRKDVSESCVDYRYVVCSIFVVGTGCSYGECKVSAAQHTTTVFTKAEESSLGLRCFLFSTVIGK